LRFRAYILIVLGLFFCQFKGNSQNQDFNLRFIFVDTPAGVLKSDNNFRGDSLQVLNQVNLILEKLQNEGYLASGIDTVIYSGGNIFAHLYSGKKYSWGKLDFSNLEKNLMDKLRLKSEFRENEPVRLTDLSGLNKDIVSYYENSGYPFAGVKYEPFSINDSVFNATVIVHKGSFYKLDSIVLKGDAKISANYIKKSLALKEDMPFNQKKWDNLDREIQNISFITLQKPSEIEFRENSIDLYLYLNPKKSSTFNGIIGFLPEDENTGKLTITGELNLNLKNELGRGEEILLNWEKLESSSQKLNVGLMYPYIFKSNFGFDFSFELFKKDTLYLTLNSDVGLRWFITNRNYFRAYYRYKSSSGIGEAKTNTINTFADATSNAIGAGYVINNLDYDVNPSRGFYLNTFAGTGFKKLKNAGIISDSLNIKADSQTTEIEAGLDLDIYFPIYNRFVFHFGNITRYMDQFADNGLEALYFENDLYRFGGAKSLRGFDESAFFASIYSLQNIEIRYLFEQNSAFYVFWNGAYYYKNISQLVTEDFPWGFGIGLNFDTRAGVFSLSYALGKQFDNPIEIRTAKIHFGYISRF